MIYGRAELVARVARSRAGVLLITGDSGVGKSEILLRAQEQSGDAVAPAPVTLDRSPGNLQRALLNALGAGLADVTRRRGLADQIGGRISRAALDVARQRASELAKALGVELLALVRHKLGPEIGGGIEAFISQLRAAGDTDIAARLNAASDPSIAETVIALAGEVADLGEGEPLLLALDAAESMRTADRGVLRDLAEALPEEVRLRLGFATYSAEHRAAVDELLASSRDVQEQPVPGLSLDAIKEWLADAGADRSMADRVERLTGGYPLLIQSVIADIRAGGDPDSAPRHQQFAAQTQLSWNALDSAARACARRLAVLPEPLPERDCAALCDISLAEYADVVDRLRRAFIMASVVNGQRWFHEQRRLFIRAQLSPAERADTHARAAERVLEHLKASNDLRWAQPLADLVAEAPPLLEADDKLAAAARIPRAELAVCAAIIELGEKQHEFVVDADNLLRHARASFGARGNLVAALRRLAERDLVALLEQPFASVTRPAWPLMAMVTLQGRAAREFGRLPIPSLTSMVFALGLRPVLGRFERVAYGIGRPSWAAVAHTLLEARKPYAEIRAAASFGEMKPALLARGRIGGRSLHLAARYESAADRDDVIEAIDGYVSELLGETLNVEEVLPHPGLAVASDRFVVALERAAGQSIAGAMGGGRLERVLQTPFDVDRMMELKAETMSLIRTLCSRREQIAADLGEPVAWHWLAGDDWVIEGAVRGNGEGSVRHFRMPDVETNDPYQVYRLVEAFELPPNAYVSTFRHAAGQRWQQADPVVDIVGHISDTMRTFNGTQQPRTIRLDEQQLADALRAARRESLAAARQLAVTVPVLGEWREPPAAEALYFVLVRTDPTKGIFYGEYAHASYEVVPSTSSEEEVHVAWIDEQDAEAGPPREDESPLQYFRRRQDQVMRAAFDKDATGGVFTTGDAHQLLAELLGYASRDLRIIRIGADGQEQPL